MTMKEHPTTCPICSGTIQSTHREWLVECRDCGLLASNFSPYEDSESSSGYTVEQHAEAFETLRKINADQVLASVAPHLPEHSKIVEIGSAQGFFLTQAKQAGYDTLGIEPNSGLFRLSKDAGHNVVQGFFPEALTDDVNGMIAFNDVFEHLPDIDQAMQDCASKLASGGLLMINLPMRSGFFYKVGAWLDRLGYGVPFARLWQEGTMSPHLYYFGIENLERLANNHGFRLLEHMRLETLTVKGLWQRLRVTANFGLPTAVIVFVATTLLAPLIRVFPADARAFVFVKE